ncbi:MAG: LysR substrate-binding domain-containing protein [Sphingomonas adhaesiva]|uniref:LysR substrate-binding domain-containing protein n=1 Tax=Sphingomonas adhaesiva TaxID=28212 RepID=UPI002FF60330
MNLRFDLRSLQIFVSVAEARSITKAADRENIAASAVSKRIVDLEEAVGAPLLSRQPRGVEVTPAGQAMLLHARGILRAIDRMSGDLSFYADGVRGTVRLLVNKSAIVQFLPEDLSSFVDRYPEIRVEVREANSPAILRGVYDGGADLGVYTFGGPHEDELEVETYRRDRLVAIVREGHALAEAKSVRFTEMLDYSLVGLAPGSAWHAMMTEMAVAAGRGIDLAYEVNSFDAVCRMVSAGLGVAIGPDGMLHAMAPNNLVELPLDEPWAMRRIKICVRDRAALSAPARLMFEHLTARSATEPDPEAPADPS